MQLTETTLDSILVDFVSNWIHESNMVCYYAHVKCAMIMSKFSDVEEDSCSCWRPRLMLQE